MYVFQIQISKQITQISFTENKNCMHNDHGNLSSQKTCVRSVDISFTLSNTKINYNGVSHEWILNAATGDLYIYIAKDRHECMHACVVWLDVCGCNACQVLVFYFCVLQV